MPVLVKNIKGTAKLSCSCGTWLKHWEKGANAVALNCEVSNCMNPAEVGAHVVRVNTMDQSHYIVPMCKTHNSMDDIVLSLKEDLKAKLIPANKQKTCG